VIAVGKESWDGERKMAAERQRRVPLGVGTIEFLYEDGWCYDSGREWRVVSYFPT